jgi:hypothetical protein
MPDQPLPESPELPKLPESPEEIQRVKAQLWDSAYEKVSTRSAVRAFGLTAQRPTVVAEGDSWFDYLPGLDILDNLRRDYGYRVIKHAAAGDTIVNMAWGTSIRRNFGELPAQLPLTLDSIRRHRPQFLLISGGGNDIAGTEFAAFLNHRDSGLPPFRKEFARSVVAVFERAYRHIIDSAFAINSDLHVIVHGYGNAIPDGTAVINFIPNFKFVGPWLRPSLARNRIDFSTTGRDIVRQLIGMHNDMLAALAADYGAQVHYIDLRPIIADSDWVNELHLTSAGYRKVAAQFHNLMQSLQQ